MTASEYHFTTVWRVEGTSGEVADVLSDPMSLPRWWPSVYLAAEELAPGDARGLGRRVRVHTRGWLPYTLTWDLLAVESDYPHRLAIAASGDFVGTGVWTIAQDGASATATYEWRVRAEKPLLRSLSPLLKPIFSANHRWAMAEGQQALALELARRRAVSDAERAAVPLPAGPVTYAGAALVAGAVAAAGLGLWLGRRAWRAARRP